MAVLHNVCVARQCFLFQNNVPRRYHHERSARAGALKVNNPTWHFQCFATTQVSQPDQRRSTSNYQPTIWSNDFVKSLKSNDKQDEAYKEAARKLEREVRIMIAEEGATPLALLELIDNIERLGLGYRFEEDITRALNKLLTSLEGQSLEEEKSVHTTALRFRLLRQHGYEISEEVFRSFKDRKNAFKACLQNDVKGLLSLYEASFLAFERETLLDEAKSFTRIRLEDLKQHTESNLAKEINHALELPLHRRTLRIEARRYIDAYSKKEDANGLLLELAKLDFNIVQSALQGDLLEALRWWKSIGLARKLSFIRDRLMECFFWTIGISFEPQLSNCRKGLTKVAVFLTAIDEIYDIHGSMDELELFTDAVNRWDVDTVKILPDYMKLFFLALYNTVNEMAYDTLKEQGENTIPILRKAWADLCQAFMVEAKWNNEKFTPTLEDYLENGWRSVAGVVILVHAYSLMSQNITNEAIDCLEKDHDLLKWPSVIFRLCNDLGTLTDELDRGETANAVACYMHETGLSEEIARQHISNLIDKAWKKMNKLGISDSPFSKPFIETALNLARLSHCAYQYGDGHGSPDMKEKKRVLSLLIEPITVVVEREKHAQLC